MTPKQREILSSLLDNSHSLDIHIKCLTKQLYTLPDYFGTDFVVDKGEFTAAEINELLLFNQRLAELEIYLCALGKKECSVLDPRVVDPNDPLDDYEIDATLYFTLREDDPAFDEDDDNFLSQRLISLKHLDRWGTQLADGLDHREPCRCFPGMLNEIAHCWLFHDLYDHNYGLERPALRLHDCLRVGSIWVDVAVRHQATLDIKTGEWQQPNA
jgi:hypothetical protein